MALLIRTPKVRIQRTKKPWLYHETQRLFAFGDLCTSILKMFATYSGNAGREAYEAARTDRMIKDTELKKQRIAYVRAQTERTLLLNQKTRADLALLERGAPGSPAGSLQHNCPRCNGLVDVPPSAETMVDVSCPACGQEWEIYPQGAEVIQ
jgi:hypothetical protein